MAADADLVRRSLAGDVEAYGELYGRHRARAALAVRRALPGAPLDAADAVQEAFLRGWCRLPDLREPERFAAWVCAIAVTTARDELRRGRRESTTGALGDAGEDLPAPAFEEVDRRLAIRDALRALPPDQRAAVTLCYLRGEAPADAARSLGVRETTLHGRLQTGRRNLRQHLARAGGGFSAPPDRGARLTLEQVLSGIQRRNLEEPRDLGGRRLVLFCAVPADLTLRPSPDGLLHVRGSVWGLGDTAVDAVSVHCDGVDDALAVGGRTPAWSSPARRPPRTAGWKRQPPAPNTGGVGCGPPWKPTRASGPTCARCSWDRRSGCPW